MELTYDQDRRHDGDPRIRRALKRMRHAFYAAIAQAVIGVAVGAWLGSSVGDPMTTVGYCIQGALVIALGYGVLRRSRVAAGMLLLLLAAGAIGRWVTTGERGTNTSLAIFGYFYVQGLRGTLDYARLARQRVVS
jgi:hypothetical protein